LLISTGHLVRLVYSLGVPLPIIPRIVEVSEFVIWALGLIALIRIPLMPIAPEHRWRILIDIAISYLGMAIILIVIWMLPGMRAASPDARQRLMFYDWMEASNLFVLNVILVRGSTPEIRRAVGWLSAAVAADTVYLIMFQYLTGRQIYDGRFLNSAFFVDGFVYFIVAFYFYCRPLPASDARSRSTLLRMINPLPFCSTLAVGTLLIISALQNLTSSVVILSAGMVLMAVLLISRVVVSARESLLLARESMLLAQEKSAVEQRAKTEKVELMMRLAGGVSHVINNLMTVVYGNVELLRMKQAPDSPNRAEIDAIGAAALNAARIGERLGLAGGGRVPGEQLQRLADAMLSIRASVMRISSNQRDITWDFSGSQGDALVAPSDLEAIVTELVANATEATQEFGKITIRIRDEVLQQGSAACPTPGPCSVLEVSDDGSGVANSDLPYVVEPFFTSRPVHEGRGLGLSLVHGIVSRYGGGLRVETIPESGLRISVYLPITPGGRPDRPEDH
jgi:signal transduction histidine kinase